MRIELISVSLFVASSAAASPDAPGATPVPRAYVHTVRPDPLATDERWGGGIRLTGLSGIGALPGVNFGGEVAGLLRRDELFIELAIGRWKPEET
nr:hypothetical protein [Deltaproteobacteria bacterium]